MERTRALLATIEFLWSELPGQIGEAWPIVEHQLTEYLVQLDTHTMPETIVQSLILDLFTPYPETYQQILALMAQSHEPSEPEIKGPVTRGLPILLNRLLHPPANRYVDISYPRLVWIETNRVSIVVRLLARPPADTAHIEKLTLQETLPVRVRIEAPGFAVLNRSEQETVVQPDADSMPLVFDLRPMLIGPTHVNFDFFQNGNPVGTSSVSVEITQHEVSAASVSSPPHILTINPGALAPDLLLYIAHERFQREAALVFTLFHAGEVGQTFEPVLLQRDPASYAEHAYERITMLTNQLDPTAHAVLGKQRILPVGDVDRRIKQLGQNLWRDLVPRSLKDLYFTEQQSWRDKTLLIVSDEPYLPWELTWPYAATGKEDDAPWCMTMRLTRWLRRDQRGNGHPAPPHRLHVKAIACIAPSDSGLPAAEEELEFVGRLAFQNHIANHSPDQPTWTDVMDLLETSGYDWLHIAAHGNFYPDAPDTDSAIWLQGLHALTPDAFVGPRVERHIAEGRCGFIFNACHSARGEWEITRIGGWANRLVSNGAGLFLAPQWTVTDDLALAFVKTLYQELLAGQPIAEAVRQARLAARRPGNPTWLAYTVYAHPNLNVFFGTDKDH